MRALWWALHAALGAGAAVVAHRFLLRSDGTWAFVGWVAALYGVMMACRWLATRGELREARLAAGWKRLSGDWLALIALFAVLFAVLNATYDGAANDGRYYFLQVRSMVLDLDLGMDADPGPMAGRRDVAELFASGAPLLWAPFYLVTHVWLWIRGLVGNEVVLDGYWYPYQRAIALATFLYGIAGLALMHDLARRHFSRNIALLSTLGIAAGSFIGWYVAVDASMSHGVSMFACTLFLYAWYRTRRDRTLGQWALLGALAGLMTLVRWQNLLLAAVPSLEVVGIHLSRLRGDRESMIRVEDLKRYLAFAAAGLAAVFPQLLIWRVARGGWLEHPARAHGVEWSRLNAADVLFSSNHGLLSWTPVLWLSLLGLGVLLWRRWRLAWPLAMVFLGQLYVNSTVEYWWGGAAFGARKFANCALVFVIGLAALLQACRRRPLIAPATVLAGLVLVNGLFMTEVERGNLPIETAVPANRLLDRVCAWTGNPFGFPQNLIVALRMGVGMSFYDRLGARSFNNLTLEMSPGEDDTWLVSGWAQPEVNPQRDFRWAVGRQAAIVVPLKASSPYTLRLTCAPFRYPGAPPQVMQVVANGAPVDRIGLRDGLSSYEVRIPAEHVRPGLNRFELRFAWARSPAELGTGEDPRQLAVQFDRVELVRR